MRPITTKKWFIDKLYPILEDINRKLVDGAIHNGADLSYAEWWAIFIKDTVSVFEIIDKKNQTRQFAMTIRSLMEFAADVSFLVKYPKNYLYQQNRLDRFMRSRKLFTYQEIAEESRKYKLREYVGNRQQDEVPTRKRIELAFSANEVALYDYLSCFTHFNIFGIRIDLNTSQTNDASILSERIVLTQSYPIILETMTVSMGAICKIEKLKSYDFSNVRKLFENMDENWKTADI